MKLYIGNKNYSSWSMRPWVLMQALGIPFEEVKLRFDFTPGSPFYTALAAVTPVAKVPVLVQPGGFAVWESLAIVEALAEAHPGVWPAAANNRARARSLCAEMHAGFGTLRNVCPMNVEAHLPEHGARFWAGNDALRRDVARIDAIWSAAQGEFLFGAFTAADAFYAPVAIRLSRFALPLSGPAAAYQARLLTHPAVAAWVADALAEADFIVEDEPYRPAPGG